MHPALTERLAAEVMARCAQLARFSEEEGRLTRTFLSPPMREVHRELRGWMEAAGMSVRTDAAGNLIGRYPAGPDPAPVLVIGSHLDTVKNAGRYDGALGVLAGVAVVQALHQAGRRLPYAIEVAGFSDEEGVRYGVPFLGSRAFASRFDPALLELTDARGVSVREAIRAFGGEVAGLESPPVPTSRGPWLGYLELHIEQGPVLAELDRPVGVVSGIVGSSRASLTFVGRAGHAGTSPMQRRRDALAGAAAFVLEAEAHARAVRGLVATVGQIEALPGAVNVIPGEARLTLDVRHAEDGVRARALRELRARAEALAARRGLALAWRDLMDQGATRMDAELRRLLAEAAGPSAPVLASGAGHDAQVLAEVMPAAMLFVRSPNGLSHHPDETVHEADVAEALAVMLRFVETLGARRAR